MNGQALRAAAIGMAGAVGTALLIGIPTDVIPNPWFGREIPVDAVDIIVLIALSLLTGALLATYALAGPTPASAERAGIGSGIVAYFAVGCPVCNKLVVALIGTSGASGWFAAIQPALGVAAVALAGAALFFRVRSIGRGECPLPKRRATAPGLR
jgi:hypothetical protein